MWHNRGEVIHRLSTGICANMTHGNNYLVKKLHLACVRARAPMRILGA
jgi:hypothetical protein